MSSCKYAIWNGTDNIYTATGQVFTPDEWRARYQWLNAPGAKGIVRTGPVNGGITSEFTDFVRSYVQKGLVLKYGMTDEEILQAISDFEDNQNSVVSDVVSNQRKLNEIFAEYLTDINNANAKVISSLQMMYNCEDTGSVI